MFGTSGIRGPVGEDVTADLALSVGRALGVDSERVVVGRDCRESGTFLVDALSAGLRESGVDVVDLGLAATPTVARAVAWEDADAGVSVTASHNPPQDNGLKLWQPSGQAFDPARREHIATRVRDGAADLAPWDETGDRYRGHAKERHVQAIVDAVDADPCPVVVDVGNGAGGVTIDALQRLGCAVETLNAQPDGTFPGRPSEPDAENCADLAAFVGATDAELGVAHDGDADRMMAVTGDGVFVPKDALLAIFARASAEPGETVAAPVDTSLAVADYLAEADIAVRHTPVGDVDVAEAASDDEVAFGGEPSGTWIWPDETLCPDGPMAACKLVELHGERPLEERLAEVPTYPIRRDSVRCSDKYATMERLVTEIRGRYDDVQTLDGARVNLEDGWFLLRASGTQPLVRITAEARDPERADEIFEMARELLASVGQT
ncbi:MAG: phosphoglucosamine mutase [Haloarculaceae archaeon]